MVECDACDDLPAVLEPEIDDGIFVNLCWRCGLDELTLKVNGKWVLLKNVPWLKGKDEQ